MNRKIEAFPHNATYAQAKAFIMAKPAKPNADYIGTRRVVVAPYQGMQGGTMGGHYVTIGLTDVIQWVMHGTVVAIWHPDGRRQIGGTSWAEHPSTREVWAHLLGVRAYKLPKNRRFFAEDYRLKTYDNTLPFGVPCVDRIHIASNGGAVPDEGMQEYTSVVTAAMRKEASATKRAMMKYVRAVCAVMPHDDVRGWGASAYVCQSVFSAWRRGDLEDVMRNLHILLDNGLAWPKMPAHIMQTLTIDMCVNLSGHNAQLLELRRGQAAVMAAVEGDA